MHRFDIALSPMEDFGREISAEVNNALSDDSASYTMAAWHHEMGQTDDCQILKPPPADAESSSHSLRADVSNIDCDKLGLKDTGGAVRGNNEDENEYVKGIKLLMIVFGMCLAVLLVSLVSIMSFALLFHKIAINSIAHLFGPRLRTTRLSPPLSLGSRMISRL